MLTTNWGEERGMSVGESEIGVRLKVDLDASQSKASSLARSDNQFSIQIP
ncbi:predicted protein [Sclerotinia sclerotiorum 1980 UF-70]|uniref:Uncharacterized protein n=1 Tax=Sclerotinia sclerotiorum (strain ATCC 18683 / 1980 / Ss-1) TaxID=665079 RepID=A7EGR2_SCLS1|nr:predicted protein [Sclerotinia sclerotiorum 1980 UF-70]EDO02028.1 predicted protein [Sclerotinia sclerotiorum 1980 UF-70]